jgi:hypothetical protein
VLRLLLLLLPLLLLLLLYLQLVCPGHVAVVEVHRRLCQQGRMVPPAIVQLLGGHLKRNQGNLAVVLQPKTHSHTPAYQ